MRKILLTVSVILIMFSTLFVSSTAIAQTGAADIVDVSIQTSIITFTPMIGNLKGTTLTITGPNGFSFQKQYDGSAHPSISSASLGDGSYAYEIVLWPNISADSGADPALRGLNALPASLMRQSGAFTVRGGSFVTSAKEPTQSQPNTTGQGNVTPLDVVNADDFIVQGSICAGSDCVNNESFGFDTIRLKENNLRLGFNDTSVDPFPTNDWTIVANDSASGGANFLAFEDVTGAKFPFKVMAGAPTDSLFVSSAGNIGIGTGAPLLDVHLTTGDTPAFRLEQTGGSGYTPQTWDIAGNEANFFVRDVTGGSRLPFRIRPGAPTSSIDIAANGNVGIGTASPADYDLQVENVAAPATLGLVHTTGSTVFLGAGAVQGVIGTKNNFPMNFYVNNIKKMTLGTTGALTVIGPVNATAFNVTSDKNAKENFAAINQKTVLERLSTIPISTWNFIENDNKTKHMGPMAQDFYAAFGLGMDNKHISTVDADGVAFAAIQELNKRNEALTTENKSLQGKVDNLAARISALEANGASSAQSSQNWLIILLVTINLGLMGIVFLFMRRGSFASIKLGNH